MNNLMKFLKKNKSFIINGIIPFVIFTLLFLAFYPGIITYDGNNQWQQVQSGVITNSHPFFSTFFILLLSKIHDTTTIVILFQMMIFSLIWGFFCQTLDCSKKKESIKIIFTILMCFVPIVGIYSITLWKDILYSYYLFLIGILFFSGFKRSFNYNVSESILFGVLLTLVFSYRHNGILVATMLIIISLIIIIKKRKVIKKYVIKKFGIMLLTFVLLIGLISIPKNIYLSNSSKEIERQQNESLTSLSTIDGYILWMMGAHIKDGNITDVEDKKILDNILSEKDWKSSYDPYIINSTTLAVGLNKKYVSENSNKIKEIFIKYSLKNPSTILKHYLNADALLISPVLKKDSYVYVFSFSEWGNPLGFEKITNSKLPIIKNGYNKIINLTFTAPFNWLYQPAIYLYLSIIISIVLALKVYGKKIWLFSTPMLLNTISLLPINLAQDLRYVYINFLTFFGLLLIFILKLDNIFSKSEGN